MRHDRAQEAISAAMDDGAALAPDVERHRESCDVCRRFESDSWRLREAARFEVAPPVPELVPAIMSQIRDQEANRLLGWGPPPNPLRAWASRLYRQRAVALAAATGLILGLVLTSGGLVPLRGSINTAALASDIPLKLVRAASDLQGYQATFDITERHWTRQVPVRTFRAELKFLAPESIWVRVHDTSTYPSAGWPRNDLELVTVGRTWEASGPDPCPSASLPACPTDRPVHRSSLNRPPFDARTAMPSDVIVPMTVLAASSRVLVTGPDRVAGRNAVDVELTYEDASPLFQYLRFLGSWRPFFPQDRVVVALDGKTWFPMRYEVFPAAGPERSLWATQMGLPAEPSDSPVFTATVRTWSTTPPSPKAFAPQPGPEAVDEGFQDAAVPRGPGARCPNGSGPLQPCTTGGLALYRYGEFPRTELRPYTESVLAYSKGLSWLTLTRVTAWSEPALFGIGQFPERVAMPGAKGVGYYLPASLTDPRRLALHTGSGEFLVATNLPRTRLLQIAAAIPVKGLPLPDAWRVRTWSGGTVEQGVAKAGFELLHPTSLPSGYQRVAEQTATSGKSVGVTLVYRRPAAEIDGVGLVLYQASGQTLAPPDSPDAQALMVGGFAARWTPESHLLEWMDGSVYRSLSAPALDLATLVGVAESLRGGSS